MNAGGRIALVCLALAGCGRIHYDPLSLARDAGRDAFVPEGVDADLDAIVIVDPDAALDASSADGGGSGLCADERVVTTTAASGPGSWREAIEAPCPAGEVCITFDLPPEMRGAEGFVVGTGGDVRLACPQMSVLGSTQGMRRGVANTGFHSHPVGASAIDLRVDEVEIEIDDRLILDESQPTVEGVAVYALVVAPEGSSATLIDVIVGASPRFTTRARRDTQPVLVLGGAGADVRTVYVGVGDDLGSDGAVAFPSGSGSTVFDLDVHATMPSAASSIVQIRGPSGLAIQHSSAVGLSGFGSAFRAELVSGFSIRESTGGAAGASCQIEVVDATGPTLSGNVGNVCIR
ncbi:MAG: hypothetical protein J0L92_28495 [Deltaproteobacteria bacterium]|nr:hypothetical protein [Deltaproteobacteria bacterium]